MCKVKEETRERKQVKAQVKIKRWKLCKIGGVLQREFRVKLRDALIKNVKLSEQFKRGGIT